jgi:exodeoxyribonuclease V beta subunit
MQTLDPITIPLSGRQLIEASAGTGKTYTITGIYVRLLLERELSPDRILVVTYTEAACQELRDKIRARLAAALALFESGTTTDPFLAELRDRYLAEGLDCKRMQGLLAMALINFDLAAVFTIHGFCMRVLQDSAFESGFPFEVEFVEDDRDLLQQVIDDYWRTRCQEWPPVLVASLCQEKISPDTLLDTIRLPLRAVQTRGMDSLRYGATRTPEAIDPGLVTALGERWQGERDEIMTLLRDSPALSRSATAYRDDRLQRWFQELDVFFVAGGSLVPPLSAIAGLSQSALVTGTKPKQLGQTPSHPIFALADQLLAELTEARAGLLIDLIGHCGPALQAVKAQSGLVSFDDLLTGVRAGLRAEEGGKALAAKVLTQYPVALIDEFQDTDPVQYEIFTTIYQEDGVLFMVGDPKQAIYGFRGADIFSYLEAAKTQEGRGHTLATNWRSEPDLIQACNALFGNHPSPFLLPGIEFREVMSPSRARRRLVLPAMDPAVLTMVTFPDEEGREEAKITVASSLAKVVEALLAAGVRGEAYFEELSSGEPLRGRALAGGDIAVLVRNHREGQWVKEALATVGLAAVTSSRQSVFDTDEARELAAILTAAAFPADERQVRRALATRLLGRDAQELARLEETEAVWEETLERFADYHRRWLERGVAAMLNHLWAREGVLSRLAGQMDGERRLTNLRHLLELLQEAAAEETLGPSGLLRWLAERRQSDRPGEASLLRLESDENLIKIVTVHKSKGLQYPVVFAPFFWDSSFMDSKTPAVVDCHDQAGAMLVDLGSGEFPENRERQRRERLAEELRLLYVALTRAENRCLLFWGRVRSGRRWATASSPMHYLLSGERCGEENLITGLEAAFAERLPEELLAPFDAIAARSGGTIARIEAQVLTTARVEIPAPCSIVGDARRFDRSLNPYLGLHSFSSLHRAEMEIEEPGQHLASGAAQTPLDGGERTDAPPVVDEAPDHDSAAFAPPLLIQGPAAERDIFSFPRGAQAGSCLHTILENFDFQEQDQTAIDSLIQEHLGLFGFSKEWTPTVRALLARLVETPLDKDRSLWLAQISRQERLDELEFYYTLPALPDQALRTMLHQGLAPAPEASGRLGFMKGFIDLVFQWQGRYYIVDYKSNYLGGELADYGQASLELAMRQSGYDLQYRIYTVALDRYLRRRLAGYDYERHFGGVYYLFLRGLDPAKGPEFGVYHARPDCPKLTLEGGTSPL